MLSSKQSGDRHTPANFMNVSQTRAYVPSWLAPRREQMDEGRGGPTADSAPGSPPASKPSGSGSGQHLTPAIPPHEPRIEIEEDDMGHLAALQGERAALNEAQQQTARLNAELAQAVTALHKSREEMLDEATRQVIELALLAASRVVAREVRLDPGLLLNVVREALQTLADRKSLKVRVGRGFEPALADVAGRLAQQGAVVELVVDPQLDVFGCIVQTEIASVDEGLAERFQALVDALSPEASW